MDPLFSGVEPFVQNGRRHHRGQFCEINLLLGQLFRRRSFLARALAVVLFKRVEHLVTNLKA